MLFILLDVNFYVIIWNLGYTLFKDVTEMVSFLAERYNVYIIPKVAKKKKISCNKMAFRTVSKEEL